MIRCGFDFTLVATGDWFPCDDWFPGKLRYLEMFGTFLCVCIIFRTLIRTKNRDPPEVSGADARYSFVIAISGVDFSAFWPLRSNHSGLEGENWIENIL